MTLTLTETITSNFKGKVYAKRGDKVEVISYEYGEVLLVKDKDGNEFPVRKEKTKCCNHTNTAGNVLQG